ncbi:protein mono-ADP-ribosyltransferase PARP12 [Betta splendens]|uniref:Protein mono-ADP-ribosyltransferase PARP12 n=1 Tax=Betta splendens TaxID=158456 RepID=A0A6P7NFI3_BETSP|nr:protein mono-ADP-ribosyltransferase PARP12 [Betta splendens]
MESEIFRFICANQGAVNVVDLVFNLDVANVSETLNNRQRFVHSCIKGQPRVLARTGLTLCRRKDCPGTCGSLHLCKNFLFSGTCHYNRSRRTCVFSHDLNTDVNQVVLQEHELETLSRAELCTLLLQSDNTLLPPICFDYNNGLGEFGRCQEGNACKRMHICEEFLKGDCSCFRSHDFNDPQPLKCLKEKGVPEDLYHSLKVIYTNKVALRRNDRSNRGNRGRGQPHSLSTGAAAANNCEATGDSGWNSQPMQVNRGRGRGGHRGNRGKRGNWGNRGNQRNLTPGQRAISSSDILADIDSLNLYTVDGRDEGSVKLSSSTSDVSMDTDASSEDGRSRSQKSASARGRGGGRKAAVGEKEANGSNDQDRRQRPRPVRDKTEICMYFIKGHCKHEEKCFKAHDKMPYRWEVREDDQWKALPNNEATEKDYCDPKNAYSSSSPAVYFDTMTRGTSQVRRLSTTNSLVEPTFIHTTVWLWYWEDELGSWNLYASAGAGHRSADIDSAYLEQKYLDNRKDVVEFTAGSQSYTLSFQDMIQTNKQYGTKRLVKRRPKFVSATDVQEQKRVRRPLVPTLAPIPDHWDKTQIPATGFKRISLQRTSDEFKEIEALFFKTMIDFDVVKIERIQNKSLWEIFQWQKNQMKINNNGRVVTEKKLFHGTNSKNVDAICSTNFDWRICGTHGTAFGKGSYFARDAKYSHSYTDDSDVKSMFVSRVLVGDFTKGSSELCRAPSKDGGDVNFFHSCVDNVQNPSIYVVFEKPQIYPEYLLQYKNAHPLVSLYGGASVAARPAPKPRVHVSVPQPSTVSHKPSSLSYQPSASASVTSSYQPRSSASSTSSYQPRASASSASSYNTVPYSYPSGTSSYRSSTASSTASNNLGTFDTWSFPLSTDSYQAPTRSSPSPPTPKPKKSSDSCVIA